MDIDSLPFHDEKEKIFCHHCFQPENELPYNCLHGCGSFRYCSEECRDSACNSEEAHHSQWKCARFQYLFMKDNGEKLLQCSVSDEEFPIEDNDPSVVFDEFSEKVKIPLGTQGTFTCLPHQINLCGSVSMRMKIYYSNDRDDKDKESQKTTIFEKRNLDHKICNVVIDHEALERATPRHIHEFNYNALMNDVKHVWMRGVVRWYNDQDYMAAIQNFEEALNLVDWNDDDYDTSSVNNMRVTKNDILAQCFGFAPPIKDDLLLRVETAESCLFLASCLLDMGDQNKAKQAQKWLFRALRTIPSTENNSKIIYLNRRIWKELMLACEEYGEMKSAQLVVQAAVDFNNIQGWSTDGMQRSGYVFYDDASESLTDESLEEQTNNDSNPFFRRKPFYTSDQEHRPSWCQILEDNFQIILNDFFDLMKNYRKTSSEELSSIAFTDNKLKEKNTTADTFGHHWPKVGSGEHRSSGHNDARVVNEGGDWRELVLFGNGAITSGAKNTRALIQKYIPDAVSLAKMGGGEIIFSLLKPKTRIAPHCASTNIRLTAHLGLVIPPPQPNAEKEGCFIRVGHCWENWKPGKVTIFDDSFEHEVKNDHDTMYRAVLLLRYWHPSLSNNFLRERALSQVLRQQKLDNLQRFNPPIFIEEQNILSSPHPVQLRCFGASVCPSCGNNGYEHVRCISNDGCETSFLCSCGTIIK